MKQGGHCSHQWTIIQTRAGTLHVGRGAAAMIDCTRPATKMKKFLKLLLEYAGGYPRCIL